MADEKFYFNPTTGEVTQGKVASWDNRMGPYDTREEAAHALEIAAQRNKAADEADEDWED
ncbi:hypothetical protein MHJ95_10570 [Corynebacterium imitans]|uniref:hypothetical protein n=1 Tax=Corynebacterium imitans TaxID=156978 RepID=UPI001EF2DD2C|nr:hypothetical protein [Corynebacterium imitans]MCG7279421.1 hypothetical protein [Corynebacterium imitans]MDK8305822.1 hypothetical protein [Corynebacterium imitans]MDK8636712.1 hypothetical protein [Corynebacterium imitans]MDK8772327.1 hypothetical protein [Corynebacterium imitans]